MEKIVPSFLFNLFQFFDAETKGVVFPLTSTQSNFYLNDIISKNSTTMGECALFFNDDFNFNIE